MAKFTNFTVSEGGQDIARVEAGKYVGRVYYTQKPSMLVCAVYNAATAEVYSVTAFAVVHGRDGMDTSAVSASQYEMMREELFNDFFDGSEVKDAALRQVVDTLLAVLFDRRVAMEDADVGINLSRASYLGFSRNLDIIDAENVSPDTVYSNKEGLRIAAENAEWDCD